LETSEVCFCRPDADGQQKQKRFLIISRLVMTVISDICTSKSDQFFFVPNCTEVVNLLKFPPVVYEISR